MKFSEKKSVNRVLLSRFIEKISSQSKKVAWQSHLYRL
jgi:hypothetical protein